jgi:glycosyltransferase involved in cell wall biosynthesis
MEPGFTLESHRQAHSADREAPTHSDRLAGLGPGGSGLAIVGEVATQFGGTERIQKAILDRFPAARAFVLGIRGSAGSELFAEERVTTVGRGRRSRPFLAPLYARRLSRLDLGPAAVVLSLSMHGWSLAPRYGPAARHIVYTCGTPASLYPPRSEDYVRARAVPLRPLIRAMRPLLRAHNRGLMNRPHRVLANSSWSAKRIVAAYGRGAEIVHPPIRTTFFTPAELPRSGLLVVARLAPQKRVSVAVDAARLAGEPLTVVGGGRLLERLRRRAPADVRFTGALSDEELRERYRSARALICPSIEEFGIVMAEAQACGTPVIAPRAGGALDIIEDGRTGILAERPDPESVAAAVRRSHSEALDPAACRASAERFSERRFIAELERVLVEELERAPAAGSGRVP